MLTVSTCIQFMNHEPTFKPSSRSNRFPGGSSTSKMNLSARVGTPIVFFFFFFFFEFYYYLKWLKLITVPGANEFRDSENDMKYSI